MSGADLTDCQGWLAKIPTRLFSINDGLAPLQFYSVHPNPRDPTGDLIAGSQDNGAWAYGGSPLWFDSTRGDAGQTAIDSAAPDVRMTTAFGVNVMVNFHGAEPARWLTTSSPLQSTVPIGPKLTPPSADEPTDYIVQLARAPGDAATLWVGSLLGKVFLSRNAAADPATVEFDRLDTASTPRRFVSVSVSVSGIVVDPENALHAWISYSGYGARTPATPGYVYEVLVDPGRGSTTWTDISSNLLDRPLSDVAFDHLSGDLFCVGTDVVIIGGGNSAGQAAAVGGARRLRIDAFEVVTGCHGLFSWMLRGKSICLAVRLASADRVAPERFIVPRRTLLRLASRRRELCRWRRERAPWSSR